jgi:hypothetical protein
MVVSSKEPAMRPSSSPVLKLAATLFLASATATFAQAPATGRGMAVLNPTQANCPVGLSASLQARGQTLWTIAKENKPSAADPTYGAGVHVHLSAFTHMAIQNATLSVSYLAPGLNLEPITQTSSQPAATNNERSKTFHLVSADPNTSALSGDLLVGPAANIQSVTVLSIQYTNGTRWSATPTSACTIQPSHVLLVATD